MKRSKKLIYLVIFLVFVSALTLIVKNTNQKKEAIAVSGETIVEVETTAINELSWEYENTTYNLTKENDIWCKSDDTDFPIDQTKVSELLETINRIGAGFEIDEVDDYKQYGLESPSMTISFSTAEQTYTLQLGDYSTMDEERYADLGDGKVYLLSSDPSETFSITYDELFAYEELPDLSNFVTYTISGENNLAIVSEENSSNTYTTLYKYFLKDGNIERTLSNTLTETLVNRISNLELITYVDYLANFADYGLVNPRLTIEATYLDEDGNEQSFKCYLSNLTSDSENEVAYFNIDGSKCVYEIAGGTLDIFLSENYQSLRPTEVLLVEPSEVEEVSINIDDEDYLITSETKDEQTYYYFNETDVDFGECLDTLMAINVKDFSSDSPSKNRELSLKVKINDKETKIEFYKYDNNYMLYRLNSVSVGYVSRSEVLDLIEEINAIVLATNQDE